MAVEGERLRGGHQRQSMLLDPGAGVAGVERERGGAEPCGGQQCQQLVERVVEEDADRAARRARRGAERPGQGGDPLSSVA